MTSKKASFLQTSWGGNRQAQADLTPERLRRRSFAEAGKALGRCRFRSKTERR